MVLKKEIIKKGLNVIKLGGTLKGMVKGKTTKEIMNWIDGAFEEC